MTVQESALMTSPLRDLVGYGRNRPQGTWPNGARLAISLVINYEEGSERSLAMGDPDQESMTEWGSYQFPDGVRNLAMESMYEYGSRVGIWRILEILEKAGVPSTFHACAVAFEQNPDVAKAAMALGHEVCSHGYRWEEVFRLSEAEEREHIRLAVESFERTCGKRPVGWYCRYGASVRTRRLVVPYTSDVNDFRYWNSPGLSQASDFFEYMKESFEVLYDESADGLRMMSVGLHPRMVGRPGRVRALKRFIEYAQGHEGVWFATREQIARAWMTRG
jgi:peptidoglycan/xylan/chitin deacetylase (PgdA/CDA1 family)